ncbi:MAG: DsbE family thiol:disulfide interchange protein [Candidatus Saccharibacteria bacterium]|nr:DsbE family thiol:disulfide interchange protein [Moraxellaceae bacterium]
MRQKKIKQLMGLLPLFIFIGLAVVLWTRLGVDPQIVPQATTNQKLPAFNLPNLAEGQLQTNSNLPTKPFVLNIWGSWCPTCAIEQPFLLKMQQQGVVLVGVNYKDQPTEALAYLAQRGNPFVLNLQDLSGDLGIDLGVTGAPESFVIDQDHRIRMHVLGEINDEVWRTQIKPCLDRLRLKGAGQCV